jgi:hypothetical protein
MDNRKFGKLNWASSALGFGCMRLPLNGNEINRPLAIKIIRYAIDHGVNYIDTAFNYHEGDSETLVGEALKDGYREKVKVATKMPTWLIHSQQDMDRYLAKQIQRLHTNYIDFYLLHSLNKNRWQKLKQLGVLDWLDRKMNEGIIKHVGFSFHDDFKTFQKIIDDYSGWTLCQIQYNFMDTDNQAGLRGLEYAGSKGLAVVVMRPLAGGKLAIAPKEIGLLWETAKVKRKPVEWALSWLWNQPQISVVLSGMSTFDQVAENVEIAAQFKLGNLTENELSLVECVKEKYKDMGFINCSDCGYCMPCPKSVNIPAILSLQHDFRMMGKPKNLKSKYLDSINPRSQARRCIKCGICEDICPQKIGIRNVLSETESVFESGYQGIGYYPKWGLRFIRYEFRKIFNQIKSEH